MGFPAQWFSFRGSNGHYPTCLSGHEVFNISRGKSGRVGSDLKISKSYESVPSRARRYSILTTARVALGLTTLSPSRGRVASDHDQRDTGHAACRATLTRKLFYIYPQSDTRIQHVKKLPRSDGGGPVSCRYSTSMIFKDLNAAT